MNGLRLLLGRMGFCAGAGTRTSPGWQSGCGLSRLAIQMRLIYHQCTGTAETDFLPGMMRGRPSAGIEKEQPAPAHSDEVQLALQEVMLPSGQKAKPFPNSAERYQIRIIAQEVVANQIGIPAETIERIAADIARVAFEEEVVIEQPWTDWAGCTHDKMIGRPVSMHAMRGISAHSNGFQTCRAIHVLQILLGSIDMPGGLCTRHLIPKASTLPRPTAGRATSIPTPLYRDRIWALSRVRRICLSATTVPPAHR